MAELEEAALGQLEPIAPREVSKHEAYGFKQSLLHNADVLSDVLGVEWEVLDVA